MNAITEQQHDSRGTGPLASPQTTTASVIVQRLTRWQAAIESRLHTQMPLLQTLEEYLLVELRMHFPDGGIDPHFIETLVDAVLRRLIDQTPLVFDHAQDAPHRWPESADRGLDIERLEAIAQAVEGAVSGFLHHYKDYLRRHWRLEAFDASLAQIIKQQMDAHFAFVDSLAQLDPMLTPQALREEIEEQDDAWRHIGQLTALATPAEHAVLQALSRVQGPDWLRWLDESDRGNLQVLQSHALQARGLLDELLDGVGSLRAYARQLAKDYARHELDMEVEPDGIEVQLRWRAVVGQPVKTYDLSELLAAGPVMEDAVSVLLVKHATWRNQPLSPAFISRMLASLDAPAEYLQALSRSYKRAELTDAMLDWFAARMRQSAFIARCAGHLKVSNHAALDALWDVLDGAPTAGTLRVCGLALPNGLHCADLLLFYREGMQGDLLLYAPGKPDGQEWIELPSLRAVSAEAGGWVSTEAGREYLLQQVPVIARDVARAYFTRVLDKPASWDLNHDVRELQAGLRECLERAVAKGLSNHLDFVELQESPRWYAGLPPDSRRVISSLNQQVRVHQQVFDEQLAGYEVFVDFAKRTVMQAIAPYMRSKGVREPVDPATVLFDYRPALSGNARVASLLELAIHGYDDNWGIDDEFGGVRSSVGQDLSKVPSADLALYIRRAYLGEQYARQVRTAFLDGSSAQYLKRRDAYRYLQLATMDRDLRIAYGKSALNADDFQSLSRQVTRLSDSPSTSNSAYEGVAVTREGMISFTVAGHIVLGVYVFACFDPKTAYWLYMPDAPDGVVFRRYLDFSGGAVAQLHDYILERVALTGRSSAARALAALAAGTTRVDTLRERHRVLDISAQFDAFIERTISDVQDITTSRAEMIKAQVIKGVFFAAAPVCMVFPPFALLLDAGSIVASARQAVEAHAQGDSQGALDQWLAAAWGSLFAVLGAASMAALLGRVAMSLKLAVRPVSLAAQRLSNVTRVAARESGPVIQPLRFKTHQAVRTRPDNLQQVTADGIFQGTYRSAPSSSQPRSTYYIRSKGRYFQVREDPYFGGLCLVDASRPTALYKLPIRRTANGKWVHNKVGLRGGDDTVRNLGRVDDLRAAFPGHVTPDVTRGALQGEAVLATFSEAVADNYLFSLNAQTCVIASLYNPVTRAGAVIHFDHNIRALIERSVRDVMRRLGGASKDIRTTLVGGDWLTGADIGEPVRSVMRRQGLRPTWDYWSYSSCLGNTYGVSLDLRSGVTSVFKTSPAQVERYYAPALTIARTGRDPVSVRARAFMARVRSEPLIADARGTVRTRQGRLASEEQLALQAFSMVIPG